jgi:fibronectin-binding autotransporter adhesin
LPASATCAAVAGKQPAPPATAQYGGRLWGPALVTATFGYAHDWIGTDRPVPMIGTAVENHGGDEVSAAAQWALPLHVEA